MSDYSKHASRANATACVLSCAAAYRASAWAQAVSMDGQTGTTIHDIYVKLRAYMRNISGALLDTADRFEVCVARSPLDKHNNNASIIKARGARGDSSTDFYITATRRLLAQSVLTLAAAYRSKPDNLALARKQHGYDPFVAAQPNKYVSMTVAYAQLGDIAMGDIATIRDRHGFYISSQLGF